MKGTIVLNLAFYLLIGSGATCQTVKWAKGLPVYDHIVIIVEENKDYDDILGKTGQERAPYINGVLCAEGANLTAMYAEEHHSEGNYFWLFSGSNQNVGFGDTIPDSTNHHPYPFTTGNLGEELIGKGLTFRGYAEGLPEIGSTVFKDKARHYARKHVPWISFGNLPGGGNPDSSTNLQWEQFPSDFNKLPTVSFVIPNLIDDMHDPWDSPKVSIRNGDEWLRSHIDPYYQWAKTHNSLLILTFDENEDRVDAMGLTNPASPQNDIKNRITTIIAGAHVKHGDFAEGKGVTHVNILRTLEAMYGLRKSGAQQTFALDFGISSDGVITDIFAP